MTVLAFSLVVDVVVTFVSAISDGNGLESWKTYDLGSLCVGCALQMSSA